MGTQKTQIHLFLKRLGKTILFQIMVFILIITGIGVSYAAWTTINTSQGASGQSLTQTLVQGMIDNINDLNTRVSNFGFNGSNVGIGTATPSSALEIAGQIKITGGSPGNGKVLTSDASGLSTWQTPSAGVSTQWTTTGANIAFTGGNVGIGVATPTFSLDVDNALRLKKASGNSRIELRGGVDGGSSSSIYMYNGSNQLNTMLSDGIYNSYINLFTGNLGIGTNSPGSKLDVNGVVNATGFKGGRLSDETTGLRIKNPGGASLASGASSVNGAIKIKLPLASYKSNTMMHMTVKIYEYAGGSVGTSRTIELGGYNYSDAGANWYNTFAFQQTLGGSDLNVRFGNDGTSQCIWIGDTSSNWAYPQVSVTDFQGGYSSYTDAIWGSGWNISFVTSLDTITQGPYLIGKGIMKDAGGHVTVPTPTASTDATTKAYVDSAVSGAGGYIQGDLYGSVCLVYYGGGVYYSHGGGGYDVGPSSGPNGTIIYPMTTCPSVTGSASFPVIVCASGFTPQTIYSNYDSSGWTSYGVRCIKT